MGMAGYVLGVIGIFLGDLWIKDRIEGSDTDKSGNVLSRGRDGECRKPMTLAGGRIRIRKYHNEGAMLNLGRGRGPMQHNFNLTGEFARKA